MSDTARESSAAHDTADAVLVHYAELGLQGPRRSRFERELRHRVNRVLRPLGVARARTEPGRLTADLGEADVAAVAAAIGRVPGVAWFALMHRLPREMSAFKRAAVRLTAADTGTFRVTVKRADRRFPVTSMEIARQMGAAIVLATDRKVDLRNHDHNYCLEVGERGAYFYTRRVEGLGGLPAGVNSAALVLLSGGAHSAVAAQRMICRGAEVHLLHFAAPGLCADRVGNRAARMAVELSRMQGEITLHSVDFTPVLEAVVEVVPAGLRSVIYRRMMLRAADCLRREHGWPVIVTGDLIGRGAAQTLENLQAMLLAAPVPVLTPLVADRRGDLMRAAERFGFDAIARLAYEDVIRHRAAADPGRGLQPERFAEAEAALDVAGLVTAVVGSAVAVSFRLGARFEPGAEVEPEDEGGDADA